MRMIKFILVAALIGCTFLQCNGQLEAFAQQQDVEEKSEDSPDEKPNVRASFSKFLLIKGETKDDDNVDFNKSFERLVDSPMDKSSSDKGPSDSSSGRTSFFPQPSFFLPPPLPPMMSSFSGGQGFQSFNKKPNMHSQSFSGQDAEYDSEGDSSKNMNYPNYGPGSSSDLKSDSNKPSSSIYKQKDKLKSKKPIEAMKIVEIYPEAEPPGCSCNPFQMMNNGWGIHKRCVKRCAAHQQHLKESYLKE